MRNLLRLLKTASAFSLATAPCFAQEWLSNPPGGTDLELRQLFRVETDGPRTRPVGGGDGGFISEIGTAFAISETALMTAKHVPHEAREFKNTSQSSVVWIPDRTVEVSFAEEKRADPDVDETQRVTITPSPFPTIDASRINLTEEQATPFPLSACDIERGGSYFLVKMRGRNLGIPVVVPITADTDEHSGAGDLRVFTYGGGIAPKDRPEAGDSGSPILDEEGRVVGLLSAILSDEQELYVTLTRDWLDLVPSNVDVACDTSVTKDDLAELQTLLTAYVDEQFEPLQAEVEALQGQAMALAETDVALDKRLGTVEDQLAAVARRTTATVQAMTDRFDGEEFQDQVFREVFEKLRNAEVLPTIDRMTRELSLERWNFSFRSYESGTDSHILNVNYDRDLSSTPFADRLDLCFKPMLPPKPGVDPLDVSATEDPTHRNYYRFADRDPLGSMRCQLKDHQRAGLGGNYRFALQLNLAGHQDIPDWNGMIYAVVFDRTKLTEGTQSPEILHRMVLVGNPEKPSDLLDCYYFGFKQDSRGGVGSDLATFATTLEDERGGVEGCQF